MYSTILVALNRCEESGPARQASRRTRRNAPGADPRGSAAGGDDQRRGRVIEPWERMQRLESPIGAELEHIARRPRRDSFAVQTVVRFGDAVEETSRVADEMAADLIVMGAPEQKRWFTGSSLAERFSRNTSRATVLVRLEGSSPEA